MPSSSWSVFDFGSIAISDEPLRLSAVSLIHGVLDADLHHSSPTVVPGRWT
jgi:hypothetical protein